MVKIVKKKSEIAKTVVSNRMVEKTEEKHNIDVNISTLKKMVKEYFNLVNNNDININTMYDNIYMFVHNKFNTICYLDDDAFHMYYNDVDGKRELIIINF